MGLPSGSLPEPFNVTVPPSITVYGPFALATGGLFTEARMDMESTPSPAGPVHVCGIDTVNRNCALLPTHGCKMLVTSTL